MNELDFILIAIILAGVVIGLWRGLIRVLIGIVGVYFTVIVAGYVYMPIGDTVTNALNEISIRISAVAARNLTFVVIVIGMTALVESLSRVTFEDTRFRSGRAFDALLGGLAGIFYGVLWASLFLVPPQYAVSQAGGVWAAALAGSTLVPTLNRIFQNAVLQVISIFFLDGVPQLYLNSVSLRTTSLFTTIAAMA